MLLDFSCERTLRGKQRSTYLAVLILALILNGNVAAPLDWPLVRVITQLGNCIPFLTLLANQAIGKGLPGVLGNKAIYSEEQGIILKLLLGNKGTLII